MCLSSTGSHFCTVTLTESNLLQCSTQSAQSVKHLQTEVSAAVWLILSQVESSLKYRGFFLKSWSLFYIGQDLWFNLMYRGHLALYIEWAIHHPFFLMNSEKWVFQQCVCVCVYKSSKSTGFYITYVNSIALIIYIITSISAAAWNCLFTAVLNEWPKYINNNVHRATYVCWIVPKLIH